MDNKNNFGLSSNNKFDKEINNNEMTNDVKLEIENEIETYEIVGLDESNIQENKISYETPLAKSILGKKKNDITKIDNYTNSYIVKIIEIFLFLHLLYIANNTTKNIIIAIVIV